MDALVGQMLGRYHVQQLLSQGRLGNLYQGWDVNLDRPVALKLLAPALTQGPEFARRFAQLARLAVRLDHPGLVRVYDFGQAADHYFIASEWLAGPTLAQLLASLRSAHQWLPLAEARRLVLTIGQAVEAAQHQGAERRLITPDKILFRWTANRPPGQPADYQPVLVDLGLTALLDDSPALRRLAPPVLAYLAPELLLRNTGDARSEIYMLGALFYELALGQPPLQAETVGQAVDAHLHQTIPAPQTLVADLPVAVAELLRQAMAYGPAERYLTLVALLTALAALPDLDAATSLPAHATAGAISLGALYRPGPESATLAPLRASLLPKADVTLPLPSPPLPPPPAADLALPTLTLAPHLQVIAPDGTIQWVELTVPVLTIGRVPDNDLVLDDPRVSRRHARLEATGNHWQVIDLQSANGTFVGKQRLPAGSGVEWDGEQPLQIGNFRLRLAREQVGLLASPAKTAALARAQIYLPSLRREVERSQIHSNPDGSVGLYVVDRSGVVDPGNRLSLALILFNQKLTAETLLLRTSGLPAGWVHAHAARYELQAGEQRQVLLAVEPPRAPQTRPERYSFRLEVAPQRQPDQCAQGEIELTVKPFVRFRAEVHPAVAQVGETLQIRLENQGNAPQAFRLQWEDEPPGLLHFAPAQADLQIPPGMTGQVELSTALQRARWLGGQREHLLHIQVATPHHASQQLVAKLISRGWLR